MTTTLRDLSNWFETQANNLLAGLERLVRIESPSHDIDGINMVQDEIARMLDGIASVSREATANGDMLFAQVKGISEERIVLLAHADTVYPRGAWSTPWRLEGDRAYGPGVNDMKGGIVAAIWALRAASNLGQPPYTVELLVTPDEEIGSQASRAAIEQIARGARAVFVVEPPTSAGDLKIARKGVGLFHLTARGRAAHQGTEPEKGTNAIVAMAEFVARALEWQDLSLGSTLGPNVISGGTTSNVVADLCRLDLDTRAWSEAEAVRIDHLVRTFQPSNGAGFEVQGGWNRPPMEPSAGTDRLFVTAQAMALELGLHVEAARVGGGSDGNFTASLAPTIDGFGALGDAAHQRDLEYIVVSELHKRAALLAGMLLWA